MKSMTEIAKPGEAGWSAGDAGALDRLSLEQALTDFEVANARVIDLTKRLVEASDELIRLRHEVELLRPEAEAARGSRAFLIARRARRFWRQLRR